MRHDPTIAARAVPLIVDLDGTLTCADIAIEAMVRYARSSPLAVFRLLAWLLAGRAVIKAMLARYAPVEATTLSLRPEVLEAIDEARAEGREVWLASACHWRNAARVARRLGLFDRVIATRRGRNLKGAAKLAAIRAAIGEGGFDYVGDARADRPIWRAARRGFSVGHVPREGRVARLGDAVPSRLRALVRAMRPHQWSKNALVLVALATAGLYADPLAIGRALFAALCVSLVASGVYLINDVLDIEADRQHRAKRLRPIARGDLPIPAALVAASGLILVAMTAAWFALGPTTFFSIAVYLALTTAYSLRLKAAMTADVIALACLYTVRIWIGAVAIGAPLTFWLLAFSMFLFLSLAYLKRYTELVDAVDRDALVKGRGYTAGDLEIVTIAGICSGIVSILVLALFANSASAEPAYATPELLWATCLPLLYWINRVWMMARRGEVDGDPVAFAVRDPRSIATAAIVVALFVAARYVELPVA